MSRTKETYDDFLEAFLAGFAGTGLGGVRAGRRYGGGRGGSCFASPEHHDKQRVRQNRIDYFVERPITKGEIMKRMMQQFWKDTQGQDLVEYALAAGLVAVAAVACMPGLSGTVNNVFTKIGSIVSNNVK